MKNIEQEIWEKEKEYFYTFYKDPTILLIHPVTYAKWIHSNYSAISYDFDKSTYYKNMRILRTYDLEENEIIVA